MQSFELFTDGACSGNPGPGGWGFILRETGASEEVLGSGAEPDTTNNRMELTAVIRGFEAISKPSRVRLVSDSEYVIKGLNEWLAGWKVRGWKTAAKKPVKNVDLWQRLDQLRSIHQVSPQWIRGHAEHPENTKCDEMAVAAIFTLRNG
ncbi:MAG: ribonuclease HI [Planctomycetes bacterium]|nr:ribonuclease HI [Planctomycetota bacterium]